jgi:hypothetical protein
MQWLCERLSLRVVVANPLQGNIGEWFVFMNFILLENACMALS